MKTDYIIGLAVSTILAGCASKSDVGGEPTARATPAAQAEQGDGEHGRMMPGQCPMDLPDTTVVAAEGDEGVGLSFTTTSSDAVAELRRRVRRMAEMQYQRGPHAMGRGRGHDGMMMGGEVAPGGRMMMPATTASVEDVEGGARLMLQPEDPAQVGALGDDVHMRARRMAAGECQ